MLATKAVHLRLTFPKLPVPSVCCRVYCPIRTGAFELCFLLLPLLP